MPVSEELFGILGVSLQHSEQMNLADLLVLGSTFSASAWKMKKVEIMGMNSGFSNSPLLVLRQRLYLAQLRRELKFKSISCFRPI